MWLPEPQSRVACVAPLAPLAEDTRGPHVRFLLQLPFVASPSALRLQRCNTNGVPFDSLRRLAHHALANTPLGSRAGPTERTAIKARWMVSYPAVLAVGTQKWPFEEAEL